MNKQMSKLSSGIQFESSQDDDQFLNDVMHSIPEHIGDQDKSPEPMKSAPKKQKKTKRLPIHESPDDTLDLHGKTREEAIMMVQNFIMTGYHHKFRTLLIITGIGKHSGKGGPVLNQVVNNWLQKNGARYIESFGPAPGEHGGAGAIWIYLH
ncbi:MAG: Smr/MutS family protein [SAR324 cluster bacterium]|nr:Smr/MutS family protein [SAR324 cluster bacterium]